MMNRVNAYHQRSIDLLQRAAPARQAAAPAAAQPAPAAAQSAPAAARPAEAKGLSAEENAMIQRYFPDSPSMSLRVYGANRSASAVSPVGLGRRLDVQG